MIWAARPTARKVVEELAFALLLSGAFVVLLLINPPYDPLFGWLAVVPPLAGGARSLVTTLRGRVVLRPDGIEVRKVRTRRYPWESLLSVTVAEDGRIEITPNGWVRKLPIPQAEVAEAFETITRWRAESEARRR